MSGRALVRFGLHRPGGVADPHDLGRLFAGGCVFLRCDCACGMLSSESSAILTPSALVVGVGFGGGSASLVRWWVWVGEWVGASFGEFEIDDSVGRLHAWQSGQPTSAPSLPKAACMAIWPWVGGDCSLLPVVAALASQGVDRDILRLV